MVRGKYNSHFTHDSFFNLGYLSSWTPTRYFPWTHTYTQSQTQTKSIDFSKQIRLPHLLRHPVTFLSHPEPTNCLATNEVQKPRFHHNVSLAQSNYVICNSACSY